MTEYKRQTNSLIVCLYMIFPIHQRKVVVSTNVEPEKTYILRVQKKKASVDVPQQTDVDTKSRSNSTERRAATDKMLKSIAEVDVHSLRTTWKSTDSDSEMGSNTSISHRQNMGLIVIVYGSATLVYLQLMLLAAFLQTAYAPPGLVFLVTSLGVIGVIVFKVSTFPQIHGFVFCD